MEHCENWCAGKVRDCVVSQAKHTVGTEFQSAGLLEHLLLLLFRSQRDQFSVQSTVAPEAVISPAIITLLIIYLGHLGVQLPT